MAEARTCQKCGSPVPMRSPESLCPRCMLLAGMAIGSGSHRSDERLDTALLASRSSSVLDTIGATIGGVPRVLLRDTAVGETPSPMIRPSNGDDSSIRYRIDGEIARGGMGSILKGRDPDLGRDVAIKVLREDLRENGELVRRFVEEAQIGGQLQHPGVVPIYELGTFADKRPFFSMKLVKGHTLADLLTARSGPADDLPRFLSIYAAVAQTMAYAHTRGVIHRDLKPSNVMVGSFGEVQVMDWGLAKVLPLGGVAADEQAGKQKPPETMIATARSGSGLDLSQAGSVLGTPSYMAPEQARGETDLINERADVFALGSILCDILTGAPAFTGRSSAEIVRKAAKGETGDALSRLDGCGAEADLVGLARDCLAAEAPDRPRDANVVSERISAYVSGAQERVQAAERERAVAVAKAIEERRGRKVQLALAASVLALTTLGGLSTTYYLQQRAASALAGQRVIDQVGTLHRQALEHPEEIQRWEVAKAAVEQAVDAGDSNATAQLASLQKQIEDGLEAAKRDKVLLDRLVEIRSAEADDEDGSDTDSAYAEAFREAEIDLAGLPPAEAGAKIRSRSPSVALGLAAALDDWAGFRRVQRQDEAGAARLSATARIADPDPSRNELRTALDQPEKAVRKAALEALAKTAKFDELGPISLQLLGTGLSAAGENGEAESVLRAAQDRHPRDVWVNYELGKVLQRLSRHDEAIRFYTAARAIRPDTAHELAHALARRGESDEAIALFRDLRALRPESARHPGCLSALLKEKGRLPEAEEMLAAAVAAGREAVRKKPNSSYAHNTLGTFLLSQDKLDEAVVEFRAGIALKPDNAESHHRLGDLLVSQSKFDEAIAAHREAIRLMPDYAEAHSCLGTALFGLGKVDEAVAAYREALRLKPYYGEAHSGLGTALIGLGKVDEAVAAYREALRLKPGFPQAHVSLGNALRQQGKADEAIAAYHEAIRLQPDLAEAHDMLGAVLGETKGGYGAAEAEFREAIRLKPNFARAYTDLGVALEGQGKHDASAVVCREAIRLDPGSGRAHYQLGNALHHQGKVPEAITEYREAIRLDPKYAEAHCNLGVMLRTQGDYAGAVEMYRKGHELGSRTPGWRYPSAQWLAETERMLALANRLPAIFKGEDKPTDNAERLVFAMMCYDRKHYCAGVRLWAEAFASDPKLGEDLEAESRYNAACTAALAAAGQGIDDPPPDDAAKAKLRAQALDWLKAELTAWARVLESGPPQARAVVEETLKQWKQDTDFAGIRDVKELAKLPEDERKQWRALWADLDALIKRATKSSPIEAKPGGGKLKRPDDRAGPKPSVAHQESPPPANPKPGVEPDNSDAFAAIHKRAHELAPSKPSEAEALFRQALEGYRKTEGPDAALTLDLTNDLAGLLSQSGRHAEAEPLFRTGLALARKKFGPEHLHTANTMAQIGLSLIQQSKWTDAEPVLRDCLAIREKRQPDVWTTFNTRSLLGGSLLGQKKYAEAEPLIVAGYEGMIAREAKIPPQGKPRLTEAGERVVKLYEAWGKTDKAAEWRAKLAKPADEAKP
jgi:tetratricopeptide (TPR) repeat protein